MSDETSRDDTTEGTVAGGNGPTEITEDSPSSESELSLDKQAERMHEKHRD